MHTVRSLTFVSVFVGLVASACGGHENTTTTNDNQASSGGTTTSSAPPSAAAAGAPFAIVPLRIVPTESSGAPRAIELRADGSIVAGERVLGRIDGTRVLDQNGQLVMEVTSDGHLSAPGHGIGPEITADGALVAPEGRIVVNADGTVEERRANGEVRPAGMRFENMPADARRTAIIVVAYITMASGEPSAPPPEVVRAPVAAEPASSAPPVASPAPAAGRRRRGH